MANERLQGEEQFHPLSHAKMHLKSAPKKLNFVMTKVILKSYTLACSCKCPCTFPHSNIALFSIKTTFYETHNILFRKNS